MEGNYIKLGKAPVLITRPELWKECRSEDEYFSRLSDEQKKPMSEPIFRIPDAEPGIIPGNL